MARIFEVTYEDIKQLNQIQLTDLLRRLVNLEAVHFKIDFPDTCVPMDINIPDGGEDGHVRWTGGPARTTHFQNRWTIFQCKAQEMPPAQCYKEMLRNPEDPSQGLKSQVEQALDAGASYVLLTTQGLVTRLIDDRKEKMREAIRDAGKNYSETADLHVYDANRISEWTNKYLSAISVVCEWRGRSILPGILTWERWNEFREYQEFPFIQSKESGDYIAALRSTFGKPGQVARIIGLSGLGKTRLALEAFRAPPGDACAGDLHHKVAYIDAAEIPDIAAVVSEWCSIGLEGIVVVDNCELRLHQQLQRHVKRASSRISVLTIDYELSPAPDTETIRIREAPDSLIQEMLRNVFKELSDLELERISRYAQGFPRMGVLLAQARLNEEPEMGSLTDKHLLDKLLWGRGQPAEQASRVISACSLFEHVGFDDDRKEEYLFIAKKVCNIAEDEFYGHVQDFKARGIINQRGRFIQVAPRPLAVRLAADWWRRSRPERARLLIESEMPGNLSEALCNRVAELDFLPEARELVKELCGELGPFGQAEMLKSERGSRLFRALAEVNPAAAAQALERAFGNQPREELIKIEDGRHNLRGTLEKLCFRRETFHPAARILLAFAAAETENWSNNSTGIFLQLFHVFLSGTQATPADRLQIIDEALASADLHVRRLAVKALGHALEISASSRSIGAEFQGSGPALEEWRPKLWKEIFDYWREALERLTSIVIGADDLAPEAMDEIPNNIRGLVAHGRLDDLEKTIKLIVENRGSYWPQGLKRIKDTLRYGGSGLPVEGYERLQEWIRMLEPQSLPEKLKLIVSIPSWQEFHEGEGKQFIDRAEERANALAEECAEDFPSLLAHLPVILEGEQRKGYSFGYRLGEKAEQPTVFIEAALRVLSTLGKERGNPVVLAGFLSATKERYPGLVEECLDRVSGDTSLMSFIVDLTRAIKPDLPYLLRIVELIERGKIDANLMKAFTYGRALEHLPPGDMELLTDRLLEFGEDGAWVALDMLYMYRFPESWLELESQFKKILLHENTKLHVERHTMDLHHWQEAAEHLLRNNDEELAKELSNRIIDSCAKGFRYSDFSYATQPVLTMLIQNYRDTIWPLLSAGLLSENRVISHRLLSLLGSRFRAEEKLGPLFTLPEEFLLDWCRKNPQQAPSIVAQVMPLFQLEQDAWTWTPLARAIINEFGNQPTVISAISSNLGTFSWVGSLIPYYERQVRPFEELCHNPIQEIRDWAGKHLHFLEKMIEHESTRESEREFGIFR